jgi:hypothetical protein
MLSEYTTLCPFVTNGLKNFTMLTSLKTPYFFEDVRNAMLFINRYILLHFWYEID